LDDPVVPAAPKVMKPLDVDHARDGEVMLAFQMNGEQLPLLNGFPIRLIVPGWYGDYWIKMLSDIEVLNAPDENWFERVGYRVPDTPHASVKPGETGFKTVPVTRLVPRSFFTNVTDGTIVKPGPAVPVRGIAFGGDSGVAQVELSADAGQNWQKTTLGLDEGTYGFRQWSTQITAPPSGSLTLQVRCTNTKGEVQPAEPNWNGGGFMRNVIERVQLKVA
jgi:DMSO/TMAO reductase YedYZ molybdopterin-dependent catalytic subunit